MHFLQSHFAGSVLDPILVHARIASWTKFHVDSTQPDLDKRNQSNDRQRTIDHKQNETRDTAGLRNWVVKVRDVTNFGSR